ncbi:hypothetical protein NHQ30_011635 [Ciborinia camelliae]|nr:hypothetical protein NHQ30_011635 [Ciborinia camelliae]
MDSKEQNMDSIETRTARQKWAILSYISKLVLLFLIGCLIGFYGLAFIDDSSFSIVDAARISTGRVFIDVGTFLEKSVNGGTLEEVGNREEVCTPEEIAGLMEEFYDLFVRMGYLDSSLISRSPHINPPINTTPAKSLGLSERSIQMMEMLPYINKPKEGKRTKWCHGVGSIGEAEFLLGGQFVDYRTDWELDEIGDLFHAVEKSDGVVRGLEEWGGKYMEPDYICLSRIDGEESAVMILNTKNCKIWTINYMNIENLDPSTQHIEIGEDWDDYLPLNRFPSRHARTVLREYMNKFKTLEWIPGGLPNGTYQGDSYARLYKENGWPDKFDLKSFEAARIKWEMDEEKKVEDEWVEKYGF